MNVWLCLYKPGTKSLISERNNSDCHKSVPIWYLEQMREKNERTAADVLLAHLLTQRFINAQRFLRYARFSTVFKMIVPEWNSWLQIEPAKIHVTEAPHPPVTIQDKRSFRTWCITSLTMTTSLLGYSFQRRRNKIKRKGKKYHETWNSQNRFFQPRSGPFSTDTLKCWVIIRRPASNIARLRLIQSHISVYETQWYGHNTQLC